MKTYTCRLEIDGGLRGGTHKRAEQVREALMSCVDSGDLEVLDLIAEEAPAGIDNDPTATAPFPAIFSNDEITMLQECLRRTGKEAWKQSLAHGDTKPYDALAARLEAFRRPAPDPVTMASAAVLHLRAARDCLKAAGAGEGRAIDRIRHAMKSAEGAVRHAEGKAVRP